MTERFWPKVDITPSCWNWKAGDNGHYGKFSVLGKSALAHRVSWFIAYGVYPPETLDHLCLNKLCVNPAHLEAVSIAVNIRRAAGIRADGTCRDGHDRWVFENNQFRCRECKNAYYRAHKRVRAPRNRKKVTS